MNDYKSETRILLNPGSGKVRKKIEQIKQIISTIPGIVTREASSLSEINQAIDHFIILQTKLLVIIGGDGTVQAVIDRFAAYLDHTWRHNEYDGQRLWHSRRSCKINHTT